MYFLIITCFLLVSASNTNGDEIVSINNDDIKHNLNNNNFTTPTKTYTIMEGNDMMSLIYQGVKKVLWNLSNDLPFLNSLSQGDSQRSVNASIIKSILQNEESRRNLQNEISLEQILLNKTFIIQQSDLLSLSKDLSTLNLNESNRTNVTISPLVCIACNNFETLDCNAPVNKDLPSIPCNNEKELCYSAHTPFGIVDRGCFNMMQHMHTHVCKCNLCNHQSISDIPIIFTRKQSWIENVFEISYKRRLQTTIFNEMSCLKCEVNVSKEVSNTPENAYCLEGNINTLPTEVCMEDQVCAVKTIREQGYVWRGCVSTPLYNYWWTFCDTDLCNNDALASIYDVTIAL